MKVVEAFLVTVAVKLLMDKQGSGQKTKLLNVLQMNVY